jgi:thymidylate kinase
MVITFSGLDGAGKSTLIAWLAATLERQDRRVAVFHMNDDIGVYAVLRWARDRVAPRRAAASEVPDARLPARLPGPGLKQRLRHAIVWNKGLRRAIYPFDLLAFLCYRLYVERVMGGVLIMDRYFYDRLVDVADGRRWWLLRLLERITPTPTLPIYLDATPEECFARKGEYSVEYLRRRWVAYRTVFPWVPTSVIVATQDLEATKATLRELVTARLTAEVSP